MSPILHGIGAWFKEWYTSILPATVNVLLILAGIFLSSGELITKIEKNVIVKSVLAVVFIALGGVGFVYEVTERHHNEKASLTLINNVQQTLDKTNDLLTKVGNLQINTALIPGVKADIAVIKGSLAVARKQTPNPNPAVISTLEKKLDDALKTKVLLSKQIISNAERSIYQLRGLGRSWDLDETRAKNDKEREGIHDAWQNRFPSTVASAREVTRQLLSLLRETSPVDQSEEIKIDGQLHGGTGPAEIQKDADYLETLVKRVIAANPDLAR